MSYYVYQLIDPRTSTPFYVGKGKGGRVSAHVKQAKAGEVGNPFKTAKILEILADGLEVEEKIVQHFIEEVAAYAAERALIEQIGIENLTNIAKGGAGGCGVRGLTVLSARLKLDAMEADASKILAPITNLSRAAKKMGYELTPIEGDCPSRQLYAFAAQTILDIRDERARLADLPDDLRLSDFEFYTGKNQKVIELISKYG